MLIDTKRKIGRSIPWTRLELVQRGYEPSSSLPTAVDTRTAVQELGLSADNIELDLVRLQDRRNLFKSALVGFVGHSPEALRHRGAPGRHDERVRSE